MASNVVPVRPGAQQIVDPASGWTWNGTQWVCGDCDDGGGGGPCGPWFPPPATQPPWYPGANGGVSFGVNPPPNPIRGHFWWDGSTLWLFDGAAWVDSATGATIDGGGGGGGGSGSGAGTVVISTTPPGNPQQGSQWWDGTVLRMWTGTQWVIIGPGQSAGPVPTTTHTFRLFHQTTTTVPVNTWTIAPFTESPNIDPQQMWDPITKKMTPHVGGVYLWFVRAYLSTPAGANAVGLLRNDGGTVNAAVEWVAIGDLGAGAAIGGWIQASGISIMNGTTDFVRTWIYSGDGNFYGSTASFVEGYLLP